LLGGGGGGLGAGGVNNRELRSKGQKKFNRIVSRDCLFRGGTNKGIRLSGPAKTCLYLGLGRGMRKRGRSSRISSSRGFHLLNPYTIKTPREKKMAKG